MHKRAFILFSNDPESDANLKGKRDNSARKLLKNVFESNIARLIVRDERRIQRFVSSAAPDFFRGRFKCSTLAQSGETFGKRFAEAFEKVFAGGFDSVCIIGNDIPRLNFRDIRKSFKLTEKFDAAVGPSTDGGFYLLTLTRKAWETISRNEFEKLPYQTNEAFSALQKMLDGSNITTARLAVKGDVDECGFVCAYLIYRKLLSEKLNEICAVFFKFYIPAHIGLGCFNRRNYTFKNLLLKPPPVYS